MCWEKHKKKTLTFFWDTEFDHPQILIVYFGRSQENFVETSILWQDFWVNFNEQKLCQLSAFYRCKITNETKIKLSDYENMSDNVTIQVNKCLMSQDKSADGTHN